MKIAICDDEKQLRSILRQKIAANSGDIKITEFSDGSELISSKERFDIIFLDIEMPKLDGMETAAKLREKGVSSLMIFLTSHEEFVRDAFKVKAFRFLPKPVNDKELYEALNEAENELSADDKLIIEQRGRIYELLSSDVLYIEAYGDGTYIYDNAGNVYDSKKQLNQWEEELSGQGFFKIHRSYMVSLGQVAKIEGTTVTLAGLQKPLSVSSRNLSAFKEAYLDHVRKNARVI